MSAPINISEFPDSGSLLQELFETLTPHVKEAERAQSLAQALSAPNSLDPYVRAFNKQIQEGTIAQPKTPTATPCGKTVDEAVESLFHKAEIQQFAIQVLPPDVYKELGSTVRLLNYTKIMELKNWPAESVKALKDIIPKLSLSLLKAIWPTTKSSEQTRNLIDLIGIENLLKLNLEQQKTIINSHYASALSTLEFIGVDNFLLCNEDKMEALIQMSLERLNFFGKERVLRMEAEVLKALNCLGLETLKLLGADACEEPSTTPGKIAALRDLEKKDEILNAIGETALRALSEDQVKAIAYAKVPVSKKLNNQIKAITPELLASIPAKTLEFALTHVPSQVLPLIREDLATMTPQQLWDHLIKRAVDQMEAMQAFTFSISSPSAQISNQVDITIYARDLGYEAMRKLSVATALKLTEISTHQTDSGRKLASLIPAIGVDNFLKLTPEQLDKLASIHQADAKKAQAIGGENLLNLPLELIQNAFYCTPEQISALGGENLSKFTSAQLFKINMQLTSERIRAIGVETLRNLDQDKIATIGKYDDVLFAKLTKADMLNLDLEHLKLYATLPTALLDIVTPSEIATLEKQDFKVIVTLSPDELIKWKGQLLEAGKNLTILVNQLRTQGDMELVTGI